MTAIVPRLDSIQYTGSNLQDLQDIIDTAGEYWSLSTFSSGVDFVKWLAPEGEQVIVPLNGYLVYHTAPPATVKGMSEADYASGYRELS